MPKSSQVMWGVPQAVIYEDSPPRPTDLRYWEKELFDRVFADRRLVEAVADLRWSQPGLSGLPLYERSLAAAAAVVRREGDVVSAEARRDARAIVDMCSAQQRSGIGPSVATYEAELRSYLERIEPRAPVVIAAPTASDAVSSQLSPPRRAAPRQRSPPPPDEQRPVAAAATASAVVGAAEAAGVEEMDASPEPSAAARGESCDAEASGDVDRLDGFKLDSDEDGGGMATTDERDWYDSDSSYDSATSDDDDDRGGGARRHLTTWRLDRGDHGKRTQYGSML